MNYIKTVRRILEEKGTTKEWVEWGKKFRWVQLEVEGWLFEIIPTFDPLEEDVNVTKKLPEFANTVLSPGENWRAWGTRNGSVKPNAYYNRHWRDLTAEQKREAFEVLTNL